MPFEEGYINQLNLGSKSAFEATPAPAAVSPLPMNEAPAGFGGQGVLSTPTSVTPPAFYGSSPSSLVGQEPTTMDRILGAMINAGTKPGDVPVTTKIQLAQAETQQKMAQTELSWRNYHKAQAVFSNVLEQQKKDNVTTAMSLIPNAIAQIRAASTPEMREHLVRGHADALKTISPGTERIIEEYGKNPFHVGMWQAAAADFSTTNPAAKQLREMIDTNGLDHVLQMPEGKALMTLMGHDGATSVTQGFDQKSAEKLHSGKMDEEEFRELYKKRMYDPNGLAWTPQLATAMESFLDTPEGEQFMVGKKVNTNQTQIALRKKEKPADLIALKKNERFAKNEAFLEFAETYPDMVDPVKVKEAKEQNAIALGDLQKQSNIGENPNNRVIQRWHDKTGHKYASVDEAVASPDSPQRTAAISAFHDSIAEQDRAAASAAMGVKMGAQHDLVTHPVYRMDSSGNVTPVSGDLTEEAYRKGGGLFTMSDDQKQKMGKLNKSKFGGLALFDAADKAYKAKTGSEQAVEVGYDLAIKAAPTAAAVANYAPDIFNYVSQRDSALGDYARSLGGEVGVLTDQDIARVVKMFPSASDTKQTRTAKRKAFENLIKINEDALKLVLIGNKGTAFEGTVSPEQLEALKRDKKTQDKINGILGSIEGRNRQVAEPISTPTTEGKQKDSRTRAERLADEMRVQ